MKKVTRSIFKQAVVEAGGKFSKKSLQKLYVHCLCKYIDLDDPNNKLKKNVASACGKYREEKTQDVMIDNDLKNIEDLRDFCVRHYALYVDKEIILYHTCSLCDGTQETKTMSESSKKTYRFILRDINDSNSDTNEKIIEGQFETKLAAQRYIYSKGRELNTDGHCYIVSKLYNTSN